MSPEIVLGQAYGKAIDAWVSRGVCWINGVRGSTLTSRLSAFSPTSSCVVKNRLDQRAVTVPDVSLLICSHARSVIVQGGCNMCTDGLQMSSRVYVG